MTDAETELLAAIERDPDDDDARRVYADWLEERGDPRGEYLRLELLLRGGPRRFRELAASLEPEWVRAVTRYYHLTLVEVGRSVIATIKLVREITGLGLRDAKNLVDGVRAGMPGLLREEVLATEADRIAQRFPPGTVVRFDPAIPERSAPATARATVVLVAVVPERRLDAIRAVREALGVSLVQAKQVVEAVLAGAATPLVRDLTPDRARSIAERFEGLGEVWIDE